MDYVHHLNLPLLLFPTVALAAIALGARKQRGLIAVLFALWTAGAALWVSTLLAGLFTPSLAVWRWLAMVRATIMGFMGVLSLIFAAVYTGRCAWLRPQRLVPLCAIPAATVLVILAGRGELVFGEITLAAAGPYTVGEHFVPGRWFPVHITYSMGLGAVAIGFLIVHFFRSFALYRRRTAIILAGAATPFLMGVVALNQPAGMPPYNWTAIGLTGTSLLWYWALFRYRLLDAMPLVRDAIVENMDDAVLILDDEDRVVDLNPAGERVLGSSRTEAVGQVLSGLSPRAQALAEEITAAEAPRSEVAIDLQTGETRFFDLHVSPVGDEADETPARIVALRDVSERVRLVHDLDAYAHTVAHDLKNPLTSILPCLDLLNGPAGNSLESDLRELVEGAGKAADKMRGIIDGLLLLASVRQQRDVPCEPVDTEPLVESVLGVRLRPMISEHDVEIRRPEGWPRALGHARWIEEVWANYVSNAIKYGGQPPRVEIGGDEQADGFVRFWVRDNGPGLTTKQRQMLFQEFTRLEPARGAGHGLGLSIVRRIVEKLGGQVGVDGEAGEGSTFWFTLPRQGGRR